MKRSGRIGKKRKKETNKHVGSYEYEIDGYGEGRGEHAVSFIRRSLVLRVGMGGARACKKMNC